jgi:hypothetical protein
LNVTLGILSHVGRDTIITTGCPVIRLIIRPVIMIQVSITENISKVAFLREMPSSNFVQGSGGFIRAVPVPAQSHYRLLEDEYNRKKSHGVSVLKEL